MTARRLALAAALLASGGTAAGQAKLTCGGLAPGQDFTLSVQGATPNGPVFFLVSLEGAGGTFIDAPGCDPELLLLAEPVTVLSAPHADAQGRASYSSLLPATTTSGRVVAFQAYDLWACQPTNYLERRIARGAGVALVCDPTPSAGAVHVVDLRAGTVRATLTGVGSPQTAVVAHDGKLAYFSDDDRHVWVVDLEADPPALASGTNPITVPTAGRDLVLSSDGRHLLSAGQSGAPDDRITGIKVETRTVVQTFAPPAGRDFCGAVGLGLDGAVVFSATGPAINRTLYGLTLTPGGSLVATGHSQPDFGLLQADGEIDVAPDGRTVVAIGDKGVNSFSLPTLAFRDDVGSGRSACFDASGTRYFLRGSSGVGVFAYTPATGNATLLFSFDAPPTWPQDPFPAPRSVAEELAFDDVANLLWLTSGTELQAYDAATGALVRTIPGVSGRGIALGPARHTKTIRRTEPVLPGPTIVR